MLRFAIIGVAICAGAAAHAQTADIPRTPDGRPDFQGVWESRWRTPLERPKDVTESVIAEDGAPAFVGILDAKLQAESGLHPDIDFDFGPLLPADGGGFRTSLIIYPENGQRPMNQAAKDLVAPNKARREEATDPEARGYAERCILGPGGAPLGVSAGNMHRQIVQTAEHVVIMTEDNNDVRIVGINQPSRPTAVVSRLGDSVGLWDGDVLRVSTRNLLTDAARPAAAANDPPRVIVETFQFRSPDALVYSYVFDDPVMLTEPYRVEYVLVRSSSPMFEVACHEGNYSLANILSGARHAEDTAKSAKP